MAGLLNRKIKYFPTIGRLLTSQYPAKLITLITALTLMASFYAAPGVGAESVPPASVPKISPANATTPDRRVVINIPSRTLWVYQGNKIIRYFPVGVGRPGFMTPIGKYSIISKVIDPGWENPYLAKGKMRLAPGEENPLGTRWMGFYQKAGGEYGMHGTDNPTSVGKYSSHGCVRMKVPDAEALFELIDVGTSVEVVYEPVLIRKKDNMIRVIVYADRFDRGMPTLAQVKAKILKQFPEASVDVEKLQTALQQANERPIDVGALPDEDILQAQIADPIPQINPTNDPLGQLPAKSPVVTIPRQPTPDPKL